MKTQLRRVKFNKGDYEGHGFDYTRIYIDIPVYDRLEKEFGVAELELEFGKEEDAQKIAHLRGKLPVAVDVEWTPAKKGGDTVNLVTRLDVIHDKPAPKLQQPN